MVAAVVGCARLPAVQVIVFAGERIFLGAAADDDCVSGSLTEPGRDGYCRVLEHGLDYVCKGYNEKVSEYHHPASGRGYLALLSS